MLQLLRLDSIKNLIFLSGLVAVLCFTVPAQAESKIEVAGTGVAVALPLVAGGITLWKQDWTGTAQLVVSTALTVGTAYGLKQFVREKRPDGSDWQSFPSDTSAVAFTPAQFLWQRYGWEYGVPAYAAATFVGWSRVNARQHHWYDVAASAVLSLSYNEIVTTRFHPYGFDTALEASPDGLYAGISYRW